MRILWHLHLCFSLIAITWTMLCNPAPESFFFLLTALWFQLFNIAGYKEAHLQKLTVLGNRRASLSSLHKLLSCRRDLFTTDICFWGPRFYCQALEQSWCGTIRNRILYSFLVLNIDCVADTWQIFDFFFFFCFLLSFPLFK